MKKVSPNLIDQQVWANLYTDRLITGHEVLSKKCLSSYERTL